MRQVLYYSTDNPTFSFINEICLQREREEDLEREARGMELLSYEVPEEWYWKLVSYSEKSEIRGTALLQYALDDYMSRHPLN